jgi:hypothetical protein
VQELVEAGINAGVDMVTLLETTVPALSSCAPDLALVYADRVAALKPDNAEMWLVIAMLRAANDDLRAARTAVDTAADLARSQKRRDLVEQAAEIRTGLANPEFPEVVKMGLSLGKLKRELED